MTTRHKKTADELGVETVEVIEYLYAGTSKAAEKLGIDACEDVSCVCCGAKISHVFWSNAGPLGGDCAATLTGDNSTRAKVRALLNKVLNKARVYHVNGLHLNGCDVLGYASHAHSRKVVFAIAKSELYARMIAVAASEIIFHERGSLTLCPVFDASGAIVHGGY